MRPPYACPPEELPYGGTCTQCPPPGPSMFAPESNHSSLCITPLETK